MNIKKGKFEKNMENTIKITPNVKIVNNLSDLQNMELVMSLDKKLIGIKATFEETQSAAVIWLNAFSNIGHTVNIHKGVISFGNSWEIEFDFKNPEDGHEDKKPFLWFDNSGSKYLSVYREQSDTFDCFNFEKNKFERFTSIDEKAFKDFKIVLSELDANGSKIIIFDSKANRS